MENLTLLGTGSVGSNKRDSGVWIRTLTSGDNAAYKCMASNSVGVTCSDYINFMVEGETTEFFQWHHIFVTNFN